MKHAHALILTLALALFACGAKAATVDFSLSWSAPTTGGPVTDYRVTCADSIGATVVDVTTAALSASATAENVATGTGSCALRARGPGGDSDPVTASWSLTVTQPPGVPGNFQIVLDCSVIDGAVVCEQV